jgi:MHS family shikimate/dehydroshikimate transporter-like MFS transporter
MLMGTGTFLIGCLPTYATIGFAAPLSLVVLRVIQGIGVGGEWGGSASVEPVKPAVTRMSSPT